MKPMEFPKPFDLIIKTDNGESLFTFERQPFPDMHRSKFKSINDSIVTIEYMIDEEVDMVKMTYKIDVKKSNNVSEIINGLELYRSASEGNTEIFGVKMPGVATLEEGLNNYIELWNKIGQVEKRLGKKFIVEHPLGLDDIEWIEKLYICLVRNVPYKSNVKIENWKIDDFTLLEDDKIDDIGNLSFEYTQSSVLTLFGQEITLYDTVLLQYVCISDYIPLKEKDKFSIVFKSPTSEGTMMMQKHFLSKEEAENYRGEFKNIDLDKIEVLK